MALLSGQTRKLSQKEENYTCEGCSSKPECNTQATVKMVGEVDSFGVEWMYLCKECSDSISKELDTTTQHCESCGVDVICKPYRDPEEGSAASQQWLCSGCRTKRNKEFEDSFAQDLGLDDDYDYIN